MPEKYKHIRRKRTPKRTARHVGRVTRAHRNLWCRWCCEPRKSMKRTGNHASRTPAKYRDPAEVPNG